MRFITEFKITEQELQYTNAPVIDYRKKRGEMSMGDMIGKAFGWESPVLEDSNRYRLEVQVFPIEQWMKFKGELRKYIELANNRELPTTFNLLMVGKLLNELESFGEPENLEASKDNDKSSSTL